MKNLAAALTASALAALLSAGAARAGIDVHWVVSGTFDDGGALSGFFDVDQYGFMTDWDLTTTGTVSKEYLRAVNSGDNTATSIDTLFDYQDYLHLQFDDALTALNDANPLTLGGASFECLGSFNCPAAGQPINRFLTAGFAVGTRTSIAGGTGGGNTPVPEPAAWALMIAGFGLAGAALRRHRGLLRA